ncbi:MAG: universal stress protein [Desulfococcaceae bacterium]|jgi:nucleotide-binding universal stress UspA family protein|nr:universal stress protein [Desulfococcaceae bacterium]
MILPQIKFKKILYATDLSESARNALAYAVSIANAYKAELIILYVLVEDVHIERRIAGHIGEETWEKIKHNNEEEARSALIGKRRDRPAIQEALDQFCENVKENIGEHHAIMDETIVVRGIPEDIIVKTAEEKNCDLIVMGSYGVSGLAEAIMGSTSRRVLRRSRIPVLVVRLEEE